MKNVAKLLAFILTICLTCGNVSLASAETTPKSSSNGTNPTTVANTDITYTMTVGDIKDVTVKAAKYYSVKGKEVISVTKNGKTLTIEAISEGQATITFKNSKKKVIQKIIITVETGDLIEDTEDTDAAATDAQPVPPTVVPGPGQQTGQTSGNDVVPTQVPVQHEEGANRPLYNGVVYLPIGTQSAITQMNSITNSETFSLTMADGYIAAVNNGEAVSANIVNGTLYITLKKSSDPYVIVADAQGKSIYRIHVLPLQ